MKRGFPRASAMVVGAWLLLAALPAGALEPTAAPLDYQVDEGLNINRLVREGAVAAHLVLRSGNDPRILIAFPAGDSGVGLWFTHRSEPVRWMLGGAPRTLQRSDRHGRPLYGVVAEVSVAAPDLQVRQAVLSSVRLLRDYQSLGTVPAAVVAQPLAQGRTLSWSRDRLDGAPGYRLTLEVTHGGLRGGRIIAGSDGRIGLRITALSGETPLTPLSGNELLNESAATDAAARDTLTFLAYREKLLAGSWRFQTYFGRDTLISVRLLMPVLSAAAIEAALGSVLERLSAQGEVAHEEAIGECAVLDHMQHDGTRSATAVLDYKMIDGDYLLAPVATAWLVHDERARPRAAAFLAAAATTGASGSRRTRGAALLANLRLVVQSASGFAAAPDTGHLIGLKAGHSVGDWRDSETGLGGGRYPYDVNAALVPAALAAAAELHESGVLSPYLTAEDEALLARAAPLAKVWRAQAPQLFAVRLTYTAAEQAIRTYADSQGIGAQPALAALGADALRFHALALDAAGSPIPVMHSDEGFALLFDDLDAQRVDEAVTVLMRPFPAGLMTEVGMVVANPAFAAASVQGSFSRNAYHGTVVWSWQQALFAAGLARQLERRDLPGPVRAHLIAAQRTLWSAIDATRSLRNSELWSWSYAAGHYQLVPFGSAAADVDESDAAQLWSTAYLAVRPAVIAVGSVAGARVASRSDAGAWPGQTRVASSD
jgi:glycogen debranching enzyme